MSSALRQTLGAGAIGALCALVVAFGTVAFSRQPVILSAPAATTAVVGADPSSGVSYGIITSGEATVTRRPDVAFISVGIESQASTAGEAQRDLASQASKLISRAKGLGIQDADINTTGYSIGPNYTQSGTIDGYRASESLELKWHNVNSVGGALDSLVQQGGATRIDVTFGLSDPSAAQADARSLAIADARTRAAAMAKAAGVQLGQVLRVSDLSATGRSASYSLAPGAADQTQVPVGPLDVSVTVEVDFAIA